MAQDAVGRLCAVGLGLRKIVIADLTRNRQTMWIMDIVWPLTALHSGPFGLWAYLAIGRDTPGRDGSDKPFWQSVLTGASHCGAGQVARSAT